MKQETPEGTDVSRREILKIGAVAGAGLVSSTVVASVAAAPGTTGDLTRAGFLKSLGLKGPLLDKQGKDALEESLGPAPRARVVADMRMIALAPDNLHPAWVAFTPDHERALVPCQDTNTLAVIDTHQYRLVATIKLDRGDVPWDVVASRDGRRAFVTNTAWDDKAYKFKTAPSTISVVDLVAGREIDAVKVGVSPNGITLHDGTDRLFVANTGDDTVSVIEADSLKTLATLKVPGYPYSIKASPSGKCVVCVNFQSASVAVIDPIRMTVLRDIKVGEVGLTEPHPEHGPGDSLNIEFVDDGHAWVTNFRSANVALVDLEAGAVKSRIAVPQSAPVFAKLIGEWYALIAGYGIFGIVDLRDQSFVQRFVPRAPIYANEFVSSIRRTDGDARVETWVTIATALAAEKMAAIPRVASNDPWAPERTHEMWTTDAVSHSVGVIPMRLPLSGARAAVDAGIETTVLSGDLRPRLLDIEEMACGLGTSTDQAKRLYRAAALPGFAFGTNWFASVTDVGRWLDEPITSAEIDTWKDTVRGGVPT